MARRGAACRASRGGRRTRPRWRGERRPEGRASSLYPPRPERPPRIDRASRLGHPQPPRALHGRELIPPGHAGLGVLSERGAVQERQGAADGGLERPAARPRNRSYWTSGGLRKRSRWLGVESACKRLIPLVGVTGLEPATFWSRTKRSTKLSYTPRKRAGAVCGPRSLLDAGRAFNGIPDADRIACARVGAQGSARERRPRDISPPGPRRGT